MKGRNAVVFGGTGKIGSAATQSLVESQFVVTQIDFAPDAAEARLVEGANLLAGDVLKPSAALSERIAQADLIITALPAAVIADAYRSLVGLARPGTLLVDTVSFKRTIADLLPTLNPEGLAFLGIDPMAGPDLRLSETQSLLVHYEGFDNDAASKAFIQWLNQEAGSKTTTVDLDTHSNIVTAQQSLAHATMFTFANSLVSTPDETETGTFGLLTARTTKIAWTTYAEIQYDNPQAGEARLRLKTVLSEIAQRLAANDVDAIAQIQSEVRSGFDQLNTRFLKSGRDVFSPRSAALALTFGSALQHFELDLARYFAASTPPFRFLVRLAAQVANADPAQLVAASQEVDRTALLQGVESLITGVDSGPESFRVMLSAYGGALGDNLESLVEAWPDAKSSLDSSLSPQR